MQGTKSTSQIGILSLMRSCDSEMHTLRLYTHTQQQVVLSCQQHSGTRSPKRGSDIQNCDIAVSALITALETF